MERLIECLNRDILTKLNEIINSEYYIESNRIVSIEQ